MSQDSNTEGTETPDQSDDNELIRSLREQIKEKDKELRARPDRASLEAELRTELERDNAIQEQLVALGHPRGLSEFLKGKLDAESDVTRESVAGQLQSLGYEVAVDETASDQEETEVSTQESDLARVSNLSREVRAASQGEDPTALSKKIGQAESPEDLAKLAQEGGFLTSYQ